MAQEKNRRRAARRKEQMARSNVRMAATVARANITGSRWEPCATCYYEGALGGCGGCVNGMIEYFD